MIFLSFAGVAVSLAHHFFYDYLHGKSLGVDPIVKSAPTLLQEQTFIRDVGNALNLVATGCFSAAMGVATVQILWRYLRKGVFSIGHINSAMIFRENPLPIPSALMLGRLRLVAIFGSSSVIVIYSTKIYASSALRVSFGSPQPLDCASMSLRELNGSVYDGTNVWPTRRVLLSGSYLPPFNPCGPVTCSYNVSFIAPALNCTNVFAAPNDPLGSNSTLIWNASIISGGTGDNLDSSNTPLMVSVTAYNGMLASIASTNCTAYNAMYSAEVTHDGQSLLQGVASQPVPDGGSALKGFMLQYAHSAFDNLLGSMSIEQGAQEASVNGALAMQFSSFFTVWPGTYNLTMDGNLTALLTSYIQNTSLSLLSGEIFASNESSPSILSPSNATCTHPVDVYEYVRVRLLATYGATTFVIAVGIFAGFFAIKNNGGGESVDVSRIMKSVLSEEMLNAQIEGEQNLELSTKVKVNAQGQFVPFQVIPKVMKTPIDGGAAIDQADDVQADVGAAGVS